MAIRIPIVKKGQELPPDGLGRLLRHVLAQDSPVAILRDALASLGLLGMTHVVLARFPGNTLRRDPEERRAATRLEGWPQARKEGRTRGAA
jgi:hypothetical protein